MSVADLLAKMKLSPKDAEVIFDPDEPVGRPTDLVMPRRRWFRRNKQNDDQVRRAMVAGSDPKSISR
jgi:hypothetical protein